jgi:hypothetical protein
MMMKPIIDAAAHKTVLFTLSYNIYRLLIINGHNIKKQEALIFI